MLCVGGGVACAEPYAYEVDRWAACDAADPVEPGVLLFAGSSSIRRWEALRRDFADYRVVQRGFGGSQLHHLLLHFDRLVALYRPAGVVVWMGTNDLATGKPAARLLDELEMFVDRLHGVNPAAHVFYLGVIETPKYGAEAAVLDDAMERIARFAGSRPRVHYIDLPAAFRSMPRGAWEGMFVDVRHVNRAGYRVWTSLLRPAVEAVIAPNAPAIDGPVEHGPGAVVLFDFGPNDRAADAVKTGLDSFGRRWNNWIPTASPNIANSGERVGDLVDADGRPTGIAVTLTGGFETNGVPAGGLTDPDPSLLGSFVVPSMTRDFFVSGGDDLWERGNDDVPGGLMISGLDPGLPYDLSFFGSASTAELQVTEYRVHGANESVARVRTGGPGAGEPSERNGNNTEVLRVRECRPDRFGQLFVDVHVAEGFHAYLNGMELRARFRPEGD